MTKNKKFTVSPKLHGSRLDVFLSEELDITRSQVQKLLETGLILHNDKEPKKGGDRVKTGDTVTVQEISTNVDSAKINLAKKDTKKKLEVTKWDIKIVAETPDYVVIEKPAGLLVHPTMAEEKNTLVSWLTKKYPKIKTVGDEPDLRPGIVHRLDKEASGLLVVAKTQKMFEHLKEQFKNRTIEKEYLALVHGRVAKDWDEINFPIARGETNDRMAARPILKRVGKQSMATLDEGEKEAKTEFLVEKRFANCTFVRVTIHTGRMHQIRVHMLAYNNPLVGDPLYFQKKRKKNLDEKLGRMFLHSIKLGFTDLHGEKQMFESPLPPELAKFLTELPIA
jgi:23S rRNA pseudouridine1911/1915/1917 synthase